MKSFHPTNPIIFLGARRRGLNWANASKGIVTVVLGEPGVGKSSLLRAGLKPSFDRMRLEPVYLCLQCSGGAHPVQQVRDEINRVLTKGQIAGLPSERARLSGNISKCKRRAGLPPMGNPSCRC